VWSRRGAGFTDRFPAIVEAVRGLPVDQVLIDGEAVVFRDDGKSDFGALPTKRDSARAAFVAFDLLRREGEDMRLWPIKARREALLRLAAKRRDDGIVFSEALAVEGAVVFAKACEMGLEGIVSKRAGRLYKSGPSRNWLKTKNPDFVRT
jgi:bifunctional non-homologous end joining protein LigD